MLRIKVSSHDWQSDLMQDWPSRGTPLARDDWLGGSGYQAWLLSQISNAGQRMALGAAKSRYGHAETGAGAVGLISALQCQQQQEQTPVLHLRNLNAYVTGIMQSATKSSPGKAIESIARLGVVECKILIHKGMLIYKIGLDMFRLHNEMSPKSASKCMCVHLQANVLKETQKKGRSGCCQ